MSNCCDEASVGRNWLTTPGGLLDIGESGMATSTRRHYERQGLSASDDRMGRRPHGPAPALSIEVLDTLAVVALCQRAGFNLAEIKAVLATGGDLEWKVLAAHKRDELRGKARQLFALADQIDHAPWDAGARTRLVPSTSRPPCGKPSLSSAQCDQPGSSRAKWNLWWCIACPRPTAGGDPGRSPLDAALCRNFWW
jgi:DNA-binding transcriptional MerR regulator